MSGIAVVGPWAKEKLEYLRRYLEFYTKVLKNQRWKTIYLDAYAGGGRAAVRPNTTASSDFPSLFATGHGDSGPIEIDSEQRELIDGSPRLALACSDPFSRYIFIDPDPVRSNELLLLQNEYGQRRSIEVLKVNACDGIEQVISSEISKSTHRGVAFLDPFGANLEWSAIQKLADTGLFEVVINFGLNMTLQRMLPNSGEVPDAWLRTLDAYFGGRDWFAEVYQQRPHTLFGVAGVEKRPDYLEQLLAFYRAKLKASFGHVSMPRLIRNTRGTPLYYLLWAGPHPKGMQGADYILSMGESVGSWKSHRSLL